MKKPPDSDTVSDAPESFGDPTFVDERQVRAFAEGLVDGSHEVTSEPTATGHDAEPSLPETRQSPRRQVGGFTTERPQTDSLWRLMGQKSSLSNTMPSATESDRSAPESGECLPEDTILAFVRGKLSRAELVRAHRHLDSCETCQILIAEAAHVITGGGIEGSNGESLATNLVCGTVLTERYRIQRFVARGGMGEVYEAYDRVLQERVALKTVTATVSDNPKAVRRLMAEVQLARRVSHPNVCRIYDLGSHKSEPGVVHFLTMEYVQGESLAKRLARDGFLPIDEALHTARHLLLGLDAAHQAGILHRDFKTDNVMLSPATSGFGRAVIMDFGLARALDADPGRLTTGANQPLVGTLSYMAPEQVEGVQLSVRTDIYAFGIVLYEMLTGHLPFAADSPAAAALRRLRDRPKRPSRHTPDLRPEIDNLVLKCLSRDPAKRYQSANEVLRDLDGIAPVEHQAPLRTRSRWKRLGIPLLALGASVVAWWVLFPEPSPHSAPPGRKQAEPAQAPVGLQPALAEGAEQKRDVSPSGDVKARSQPLSEKTTPARAPNGSRPPHSMRATTRTSVQAARRSQPAAATSAEPTPEAMAPSASAPPSDDALIVPKIFRRDQRPPAADGPNSPSVGPSAPPGRPSPPSSPSLADTGG